MLLLYILLLDWLLWSWLCNRLLNRLLRLYWSVLLLWLLHRLYCACLLSRNCKSLIRHIILLELWLYCCFISFIVLFLIGIEYMKDSLERRLSLDALSDTQVQALYTGRKHRQGDGGEAQR